VIFYQSIRAGPKQKRGMGDVPFGSGCFAILLRNTFSVRFEIERLLR
jgi:hypothetical protein